MNAVDEALDSAQGIEPQTIRRLLAATPSRDLVAFLLKRARENKAFRRKLLAWVIDTYADQIPADAVQSEIAGWIEDVFDPGSALTPRAPDLRDLTVVRTAVRRHPELAVFAHLAVVDGIGDWLSAYGRGPDSFYQAFARHFEWAASALPGVQDEAARSGALRDLEEAVVRGSDFGYGLDYTTALALSGLSALYPDRAFDYASIAERCLERRMRRRRCRQPGA